MLPPGAPGNLVLQLAQSSQPAGQQAFSSWLRSKRDDLMVKQQEAAGVPEALPHPRAPPIGQLLPGYSGLIGSSGMCLGSEEQTEEIKWNHYRQTAKLLKSSRLRPKERFCSCFK